MQRASIEHLRNAKFLQYEINDVRAYLKELKKLKEEVIPAPLTHVAFILTMPSKGSWDGKWTGDAYVHARTKQRLKGRKNLFPTLTEGSHYYRWSDGWAAVVKVKFVSAKEAKELNRESRGFAGYDHFIDEIIKYGKITNGEQ